jgi:hypothetical protein
MTAATFDTLAYAKRLREAGVPEQQAEVQASVLAEALATSRNELATRADLENLRVELKAEISVVKAELAMIKWLVGGCGFGILLLIVRTFFGTH